MGTTDDTAAFQKALDAGGVIAIPQEPILFRISYGIRSLEPF